MNMYKIGDKLILVTCPRGFNKESFEKLKNQPLTVVDTDSDGCSVTIDSGLEILSYGEIFSNKFYGYNIRFQKIQE